VQKILIAEDDTSLNKIITDYLTSYGYNVISVFNGKDAIEKVKEQPFDLILSDIMMPYMDGFSVAESVRKLDDKIPIIFMSARDDKPSKMLGYRIGVDDYLVKPFDLDELVLKVGAYFRRLKVEKVPTLTVGNLTMNKDEHTVSIDGEEVLFTVKEFDLLYKFLSNPKKSFTRSALMDEFWDYDTSATSRTVDVYMAKLREKTANCDGFNIVTVHGLGYKAVLK
jgi:DNA-binding response OmpR family regulator